jgi:6-phosphogluconolactonase
VPTHPAHLALAPGGQLLLSTRGPDVVTAFDVTGDELRTVAEAGTGGRWPRQFAVVDRWVLVCDEFDDRVVVLEVDPATGALRPTGQQLEVGTPACVVAAT